MDIDTSALKESSLARVVLFYTKSLRSTSHVKRQADALVAAWSRPIIKRSASFRSKVVEVKDYSKKDMRKVNFREVIGKGAREGREGRVPGEGDGEEKGKRTRVSIPQVTVRPEISPRKLLHIGLTIILFFACVFSEPALLDRSLKSISGSREHANAKSGQGGHEQARREAQGDNQEIERGQVAGEDVIKFTFRFHSRSFVCTVRQNEVYTCIHDLACSLAEIPPIKRSAAHS